MTYFILNIFLSAFLLFQIQPIIAKYILPWFGGTPAVWTTVQMYFQILLTAGYAYANWMIGRTRENRREYVHIILILITFLQIVAMGFLWKSPVTPDISWRPQGNSFPILAIFILLTISVGPAYFLLSTNSPIMQAWFNRAFPKRSPYALYALSNTGSLLALITYPIFVEPNTILYVQGWYWAAGFLIFAALTIFGAIKSIRTIEIANEPILSAIESRPVPDGKTQILWLLLSGCASILLLATTNHLTQEVAVVPFLWVLPLTIYLLTFIIAFSNEKWYPQRAIFYIYYVCTLLFAFAMLRGPNLGVPFQIIIFTLTLFVG